MTSLFSPRRVGLAAAAVVTAGALATAGLVAFAPGAGAGTTPSSHHVTLTHPDADHAGSSLAGKPHAAGVVHPADGVPGLDVSNYQGAVDWNAVKANGAQFAYMKATESTTYTNPSFAQQYNGSYQAGLIRGVYHFAVPNASSGAAQADYLVAHGGGWSNDGKTLPAALDIEYNPYGSKCYDLNQGAMVGWITDFVNEYHAKTSRWAVIYTTTDWWSTCTGNSAAFAANDPIWVANYNGSPGNLPGGYSTWTFWQSADHGTFPGDQDTFNGPTDRLVALAKG